MQIGENEVLLKELLLVKFNGECNVTPEGDERFFHPVGGFQYKHLVFPLVAKKPLCIEIKTKNK